ncbi:MAG TPA: nucleotidyltransferase family protein [Bacteroidota bacterium]|nr:nucleotidyltransferase family protein [Bacteroidota bacterium]
MTSVSAILLAAGSSQRMGVPKALLTIDGKTFLQHLVDAVHAAGPDDVRIILGAEAVLLQSTLSWYHGNVVVNENWRDGQLSSMIAGINSLTEEQCSGVLFVPVDHPLITSALIKELLHIFEESKEQIVVPTYQNRRGHPIVVPSVLFQEIKNAPVEVGLRYVVHAHEGKIVEVPTDEEGVIINIDTPDEYQKYIISRNAQEPIADEFRS